MNEKQKQNEHTNKVKNKAAFHLTKNKWLVPVGLLLIAVLYYSPYLSFDKIIMGTDDGPRGWLSKGDYGHVVKSYDDTWSPLNGGTAIMEMRYGRFINPIRPLYVLLYKYQARVFEYIFWTFIAGLFAFLFLRFLGISRAVSFVCAISYMLAPAMQSYIFGGHFARMEVISLLPGMMYFTERMLQNVNLFNLVGLAIIMSFAIYSEHLQLAYFSYFGMGIYFAARMIHMVFVKKEIPVPEGVRRTSLFITTLAVFALLTAMNTIPSLYNTTVSSKRAGGVDYEYAASFSLHPEELFSLIEPDFIGWREFYWGQNPLKLNSEYFGVLVLLLAIMLFLFRKQDFKKWLFVGLFVFALLFTLGAHTPVHKILYYILPGIKSFRGPSMMYIWFFLSSVALAGYALDELLSFGWKENSSIARRLAIFAACACGFLFLYMIANESFAKFWYSSIFPAAMQSDNNYNALTHSLKNIKTGSAVIFFIVCAFFALAYLKSTNIINRTTFLVLFTGICLIDLLRISTPFMLQCGKPKNYFLAQERFEQSVGQYLNQKDNTLFRVHSLLQDQKMYIPGLDMTYIFDDFINQRYYDLVQVLLSVSYAMQQQQYASDPAVQNNFRNIMSILNTKYVLALSPVNLPGFHEVINSGGFRIYENASSFPRFYLANNVIPSTDPKQTMLQMMNGSLFDQNAVVVDKQEWKNDIRDTAVDSTIANSVKVLEYTIRKGIERLEVVSNREQILVALENYNPGWHAFINGKEVSLQQVNHFGKGVIVPKGKSTVTFTYSSKIALFWRKVTVVSVIIFGLFSIVVLALYIRNRKKQE